MRSRGLGRGPESFGTLEDVRDEQKMSENRKKTKFVGLTTLLLLVWVLWKEKKAKNTMTSNLPFSVSSFSHTSTFYDYNLHPIEQAEPLPLPIWNDVGNVNNHPPLHLSRVYPRLEPLVNIYARWPQDELKRWEAGEEKDYKKIRPFKVRRSERQRAKVERNRELRGAIQPHSRFASLIAGKPCRVRLS